MYLNQVYILSCFVIFLSAATIKAPNELNRPKRTIQYFWDGLFSVLKDRLPMAARTEFTAQPVNDHRASTILSLAKLSSTSTPSKNVEYFDDDDFLQNTLNLNPVKLPLPIQMPIPSIASTFLASAENRVLQPAMTKRVELDVKMPKQSSKNTTNQVEQTVSKAISTSTTTAPKQILVTTVAPSQTQPIDLITLNQTQSTTMAPNHTQTTTITSTTATTTTKMTTTTEEPRRNIPVESESTTIKADNETEILDLTTFDPLELAMIDTKNLSSSNGDDTQTKMEKRNAPMKASDLHTTQFFDGPLLVENDPSAYKPIYLDNCIEINCNKDINVIQSRNSLPSSRAAPIVSMTIALPASTSAIDQRRQSNGQSPIQNYNVFTLHTHIPIYTEVNPKRLSNEIIDPPSARKAQ